MRGMNKSKRAWLGASWLLAAALVVGVGSLGTRTTAPDDRPSDRSPAAEASAAGWLAWSQAPAVSAAERDTRDTELALGGPLLNPVYLENGDALQALRQAPAKRLRYAKLNPAWLDGKRSPLFAPGARFELELFADTQLSLVVERAETVGPDSHVIEAWAEGEEDSRVIFSLVDGSLSLSALVGHDQRFEVNLAEDDIYQIYEIDMGLIPDCDGPLEAVHAAGHQAAETDRASQPVATVAAADPLWPSSADELDRLTVQIDLLMLYTDKVRQAGHSEAAIRSRSQLAVAEANSDFRRSGVPLRIRLVETLEVSYPENADNEETLGHLRRANSGRLDSVHELRDRYGADLVCLLVEQSDPKSVGIAYILSNPASAFNHAWGFSLVEYRFVTGTSVFTHELGHNLGAAHDRENSKSEGAFPFSYGHRMQDSAGVTYRTIMAYRPGERVGYFSNPRLTLPVAGNPALGIPVGQPDEADNAETLYRTGFIVSGYRLRADPTDQGRLVNVSTRAHLGVGVEALIGGFVVGGNQSKQVILRALGPSLSQYGIGAPVQEPVMRLYRGDRLIAENSRWRDHADASEVAAAGLAPEDGREPALSVWLEPGAYTVVVEAEDGQAGVGMVEAYERSDHGPRLINLSTRGYVGSGERMMFGGFVLNGPPGEAKRILIRALGPSLSNWGVQGSLFDPAITLHAANGRVLLENDDWDASNQQGAIRATGLAPLNRRESAMIVELMPGSYTVSLRPFAGAGGVAPGIGLVEVYELSP
jgi:hypothetical protein